MVNSFFYSRFKIYRLLQKLDYQKILIYRIGHLGDTLVSLPAFWAIRENFPDASVTLLTNVDARNAGYIAAHGVLPESGLIDDWLFIRTI